LHDTNLHSHKHDHTARTLIVVWTYVDATSHRLLAARLDVDVCDGEITS
jgi:hypothetical protein